MSILDTRAWASGFAGACLLTLLQTAERHSGSESREDSEPARRAGTLERIPGSSLLAHSAYFMLVGAASRPVAAGALLGACAGIGKVVWGGRRGAGGAGSIALHTLAGLAAGAAYQGLTSEGWPARDWDEAFFP